MVKTTLWARAAEMEAIAHDNFLLQEAGEIRRKLEHLSRRVSKTIEAGGYAKQEVADRQRTRDAYGYLLELFMRSV